MFEIINECGFCENKYNTVVQSKSTFDNLKSSAKINLIHIR